MIFLIKEDSSILPKVHLCLTMKCFRWNVVMFVSQSHLIFVSNGLSHWFYALWDRRSYSDLSICNACCLAIVQLAGHALVGVHQVTQRVIHLVLMIMATIMMMWCQWWRQWCSADTDDDGDICDWSCSSRCSPSDAACYTAAPPPSASKQGVQYATLDIFHFPNREISVRFNAFKQGKHGHQVTPLPFQRWQQPLWLTK